jgi:hypothetical protein
LRGNKWPSNLFFFAHAAYYYLFLSDLREVFTRSQTVQHASMTRVVPPCIAITVNAKLRDIMVNHAIGQQDANQETAWEVSVITDILVNPVKSLLIANKVFACLIKLAAILLSDLIFCETEITPGIKPTCRNR